MQTSASSNPHHSSKNIFNMRKECYVRLLYLLFFSCQQQWFWILSWILIKMVFIKFGDLHNFFLSLTNKWFIVFKGIIGFKRFIVFKKYTHPKLVHSTDVSLYIEFEFLKEKIFLKLSTRLFVKIVLVVGKEVVYKRESW